MVFLLKDYLLLIVLRFYITVLRMLRNRYKTFTVKQETKMSQVKGELHLMDLNKIVNFIYQKFDKFERSRAEKGKIINELQKNVNDISATIEFLKGSLDDKSSTHRRTAC